MTDAERVNFWMDMAGGDPWLALFVGARNMRESSSQAFSRETYLLSKGGAERYRKAIDDNDAWIETGKDGTTKAVAG